MKLQGIRRQIDNRAIRAKRLRRAFNKRYDLSVGDRISFYGCGEETAFRGISTFKDPSRIQVLAYIINKDPDKVGGKEKKTHFLEPYLEFGNELVPIVPVVTNPPDVE